ncbi:MAG TPA: methyltransferase, partial [Polyangiaceae bacterium LLY-WYZ-15_(1-7)]|nr:methyltransferase [Polyangiaceae bacterium LLY-WYZ-15_(1-7)]
LTRALRERLALPALGLERDPARVRVARELAGPAGPRFEATDASRAIPAGPGDLLVGLHACGGLGDALVTRAAATGAHALLVSCCHQKIDGPARAPLSRLARDRGFELPREALGLANLAYGLEIVSGGAEAIQRGRETRHALALLLHERGVDLGPGDEARGIGRDRFRKGLAHVAPRALARRGLAQPGPTELETTLARAREEHGRMRRLGLPRGLLGRLLELALVLDRAVALEEAGHAVRVEPAFPAQVSPRNLALLARARS